MTAGPSENAARLADAQAHLAAARKPRAAGPGPEPETLRRAYLDLLKLALCDLAGASTLSVGAAEDGTVMSRELREDGLRLRVAGMDWPLQGLTMVGLGRLDDLQQCLESVVDDGVAGDVIEAGAWRGGASILMRATLDSLGDERTVWVADSFQGFPQLDGADEHAVRLSAFEFLAAPLEEVRASFARLGLDRGVEFVPGFFEETLAALTGRRWAVVRLDADSYEATRLALQCLYRGLSTGGYLVIDDYGSFDGCRQAVDEFRREHGITEPIESVDHTCARWRREDDRPIEAVPEPAVVPPRRAAARSRDAQVPTAHELELEDEAASLRERLRAAEAQIGLRSWIRHRLRLGGRR
jgi:O-methyltransferase